MTQNLKLPICPKCHDTKSVRSFELKSTKLDYASETFACDSCGITWNDSGIQESLQMQLAKEFGLILGQLYWVSYRDPDYPCDCDCHKEGATIRHIDSCCYNKSFERISRYIGVYRDPKRGNYFNFYDDDPNRSSKKEYPIYHDMLQDYEIVINRGGYSSKKKVRKNPKDFPVDFSLIRSETT